MHTENRATTLPTTPLTGDALAMQPLADNDPRLHTMPCLPMPFGRWGDVHGMRTFIADPKVYLWNDALYAHPETIRRLNLS